MAKWYKIEAKAGAIDIAIFDEIGGWGYSASDFSRDLAAAGDGKINLRINSPGGDVFQGSAIYNILSRVRDRVTVTIEGVAASMASVIAMAGKTIIMPENAMMMIHDPAGIVMGGAEEIASYAEMMNTVRDNIAKAYADRTGKSLDDIRQMMAKETWLSAEQAVSEGFADKIEKPVRMAARAGFDLSCYRNVPQSLGTQTAEENMNEEIKRLCALFGKADLAQGFIDGKKTVADVLTALEKVAKDEKDAATATAAAAVAAATARAAEGKAPTAEEIRASVVAEMEEIRALCSLAGMSDKADGFIKDKKSPKQVATALATLKAEAEEAAAKGKGKKQATAAELSARHVPKQQDEGTAVPLDTSAVWDKYNAKGKAK